MSRVRDNAPASNNQVVHSSQASGDISEEDAQDIRQDRDQQTLKNQIANFLHKAEHQAKMTWFQ